MNITDIFLRSIWQAISHIWWIFPLLLIIAWLKSPKIKGIFGEKMVQTRAILKLDSKIYRPFHDLIVPIGKQTTQIDHVFVSVYGIFVVETKNYQGWIFGGENQANWTQVLYKKKSSFQNPLRQNFKHIKALAEILRLPENVFHSVIVFTHHQYKFKTAMPENVCDLTKFDAYIRQFRQTLLTENDVQAACDLLANPDYVATRQRNKQHIQQFNKR